ncbi:hypothetical protein DFJ74DRAFT_686485 [Hyaloraphidium curvatum]|nr:hypothetical protein DFJ74DRAFT_686485 [Hyaloraphidium curvatum]
MKSPSSGDVVRFVLGVFFIAAPCRAVLQSPALAPVFFVRTAPILLLLRIPHFIRVKWGFYLFDFCYFASVFAFLECWARTRTSGPDPAIFAMLTGPVLMAHVPWTMPLLPHHLDGLVSIYLHTAAPLVYYVLRWIEPGSGPAATVGPWDLLVRPAGLYLLWQVLYLLVTEVVFASVLRQDKDQETSLRFMAIAHREGSPVVTLARRLNLLAKGEQLDADRWGTKVTFVVVQGIYTAAALGVAYLCWQSFAIHTATMLAVCGHSIRHGLIFYAEHYALWRQSMAR